MAFAFSKADIMAPFCNILSVKTRFVWSQEKGRLTALVSDWFKEGSGLSCVKSTVDALERQWDVADLAGG